MKAQKAGAHEDQGCGKEGLLGGDSEGRGSASEGKRGPDEDQGGTREGLRGDSEVQGSASEGLGGAIVKAYGVSESRL